MDELDGVVPGCRTDGLLALGALDHVNPLVGAIPSRLMLDLPRHPLSPLAPRHRCLPASSALAAVNPRYTNLMPAAIAPPMHRTKVARPFHHEGWLYEEKVDGYRVLAYKDGERVRLISRDAKDLTARFSELVQAIVSLRPEILMLDGEVAV